MVAFVRGFIDRSTNGSVMAVAVWVGPIARWASFDPSWRRVRSDAGIAEKFHMTDYAAKRREYAGWPDDKRRQVVDDLLRFTRETVTYGVSVSVNVAEYSTLRRDLHPFVYCASQAISLVAHRLQERGIDGRAFYIYDDGETHGGEFREAMNDLAVAGEIFREMFRIHSMAPGRGKDWPGLDAADYLAWAGSHGEGHYRGLVKNDAEFIDLRGDVLRKTIETMTAQPITAEQRRALQRIARRWGYRRDEV